MSKYRDYIVGAVFIFIIVFSLMSNYFFNNNRKEQNRKIREEKIEEFDTTNPLTDKNRYSLKNISHDEMAKLYFNDYMNLVVNYPDEAYSLVENSGEITKRAFLQYVEKVKANYYSYQFKSYTYHQVNETNDYIYRVVNSKNEVFIFKTAAVMNYSVDITM